MLPPNAPHWESHGFQYLASLGNQEPQPKRPEQFNCGNTERADDQQSKKALNVLQQTFCET